MESRLLQTQQCRSLASLIDNLSILIDDWVSIVSDSTEDMEGEFQKTLLSLTSLEIPLPQTKKDTDNAGNNDQFMDELAALSSLDIPTISDESAMAALADLASFNNPPPKEPENPIDDLSSLTLPETFDNFLLPKKGKKKMRVGGLGRRAGRSAKKNYGMDPSIFELPVGKQETDKEVKDSFGLNSLEALTAALRLNSDDIASPRTASRHNHSPIGFDDFFKGLNNAGDSNENTTQIAPRENKLLRAYGAREDMNKRGMQKTKKKSQLSARGKGVYQMEDAHCIHSPFHENEEQSLFCVFDGHVDKNAAIAATTLFPEELFKNMNGNPIGNDCGALLRQTFLSTDSRMLQYDMEGSTGTSVLFWRENNIRYVQTANVGDSSAFLCRDDTAIMLTVDHKVNDPTERQRLLDAGLELAVGATRINGLGVSRALGDHFIKDNFKGVTAEPHLSAPYELQDADSLLIVASDGLWDTMTGQDAYDAIKKSKDPQMMASTLVNMALSSGLCNDNITVIVVLLN